MLTQELYLSNNVVMYAARNTGNVGQYLLTKT